MTTIAYKNGILAADKQADCNGWKHNVTKIRRLGDGRLLAGAGGFAFMLQMYAWIEQGADPAKFPQAQTSKDDWEPILVVETDGRVLRYERTPYPIQIESEFCALGSGRDFALMAMRLGKSAPEAVQLASEFDPHTGVDVDTLTIPQPLEAWRARRLESYPGHGMAGPVVKPLWHGPVDHQGRPVAIDAAYAASAGSLLQLQHRQRPQLREPGEKVPGRA